MPSAATASAPELIGAPPPRASRDRMVQVWLLASVVSWLGTSAWSVALAWVAVQIFAPGQAGLVVTVATLPQALLTMVGGAIADRWDTRRLMIAGQVGSATVMLLGALAWSHLPHLPLLLAVGIAFGIVAGLTQPAGATLVRQLVAADDLATVSGWNQIGARLARLAGAPVGAWLVVTAGLPAVMVLNGISFLVTAVALWRVIRPRYRLHREPAASWWSGLAGGLGYLRRDATALAFVVGLAGLNVFSSPLMSLGVPLRITAAAWSAATLGVAEATFSAAAIAGSLVAIPLRPARPAWAGFLLLAVQGLSYGLIAIPHQATLLAAMTVIGLTGGCVSVWLSSEFARIIEPAYLGRTASLSTLGDLLLIPLATPAFGILTRSIGIGLSPWALAAAMVALCLGIASYPRIRSLDGPGRPRGARLTRHRA